MTHKEKAEAYVRERLPELSEDEWEPIQLSHWLRVLASFSEKMNDYILDEAYFSFVDDEGISWLSFNITTGQPATEADYKAFCEIVGVYFIR